MAPQGDTNLTKGVGGGGLATKIHGCGCRKDIKMRW